MAGQKGEKLKGRLVKRAKFDVVVDLEQVVTVGSGKASAGADKATREQVSTELEQHARRNCEKTICPLEGNPPGCVEKCMKDILGKR